MNKPLDSAGTAAPYRGESNDANLHPRIWRLHQLTADGFDQGINVGFVADNEVFEVNQNLSHNPFALLVHDLAKLFVRCLFAFVQPIVEWLDVA